MEFIQKIKSLTTHITKKKLEKQTSKFIYKLLNKQSNVNC